MGVAGLGLLGVAFLGDLGVMGTAVATNMPVSALFLSAVLNPVEAFRLAALTAFSGSLDVLGPAGQYAVDTFADSLDWMLFVVVSAWVALPAAAAWWRFSHGGDV